jgi:hypothetical protein
MAMPIEPKHLVEAINRAHGLALVLAERYAGGEQGAYRVVAPGGARLVLKWSVGRMHLARFRHAATVASQLHALGYPVPRYEISGLVGEVAYMLQSELPGAPLRYLDRTQLPALLALNRLQAGQATHSGHTRAIAWPGAVADTVLHGGAGYCLLETMRDHSAETSALLGVLQTVVATHAGAACPTGDIVHFDFTPANILAQDGRISGVIDWEGACAGDRAFDLATLLFYCYDDVDIRAWLWARALEHSSVGALRIYLAHLILRQVEWSIRHHGPAAAGHWLARADQVLRELVLP